MLTMTTRGALGLAALLLATTASATTTNGFANGGFEAPPTGGPEFAAGWLAAPTGNPAQWSSVAHSGSHSALLTIPNGFGGSTLFQDSVAHGGLPPLGAGNVGDQPLLTFWAKGDVSTTGNVLFALRYLGANGGILWDSGNHFFQGQINPNSWTQISFQAGVIPAGTKAVFLEMNTAVGPLLDGRPNAVYIDDVQLKLTAAVPEPSSVALLLSGLAVTVGIACRRRA